MSPRTAFSLPQDDLQEITLRAGNDLDSLRDARIFLTGCTGFFGSWLIEALLFANVELGLNMRLAALSRRPDAYLGKMPHLSEHRALTMVEGDICSFPVEKVSFSHAVHGATAVMDGSYDWPVRQIEIEVQGAKRLMDAARASGCRSVLYLSSGAAYSAEAGAVVQASREDGQTLRTFREHQSRAEDNLAEMNVYGLTKRFAEVYITALGRACGIRTPLARCFTFVGPRLPLDGNLALGNFLCDAMSRRDIVIQGDGTPLRSYMYASDLVVWLLALLVRGRHGTPYNVGSNRAVSIRQAAEAVAGAVPELNIRVRILGDSTKQGASSVYLPDTRRSEDEFGLSCNVGFEQAIKKTVAWLRLQKGCLL